MISSSGVFERQFPIILSEHEKRNYELLPTSIPWEMVAPHYGQAHSNHGQSLERLAERGGLCLSELVAVLENRRWASMHTTTAVARLRELIVHWSIMKE